MERKFFIRSVVSLWRAPDIWQKSGADLINSEFPAFFLDFDGLIIDNVVVKEEHRMPGNMSSSLQKKNQWRTLKPLVF